MPGDDNGEPEVDNDNLLQTFIGILRSEDVQKLTEKVFDFVRRGRETALSIISEDEDEISYNLDVLENPETELRIVDRGPDEPPFREIKIDDEEIVEMNIAVLDDEEREIVEEKIENGFESQGRILTHEQELGYDVAEGAKNDPIIHEILEFFDFLPNRDQQLIKRGLSIRKAWEDESIYITRDQMEEWKQDLDQKFGDYGSTVANFCSSGYYDTGEVMQEIMGQILEEYDEEKSQSLYYDILDNEPFVVYVGRFDNAWQTSVDVRSKLKQYDSYPYNVPFVDLRAQGYRNMRVAEQAFEHLRDDIPNIAFETHHSEIEFVLRIYPAEVEDLEG